MPAGQNRCITAAHSACQARRCSRQDPLSISKLRVPPCCFLPHAQLRVHAATRDSPACGAQFSTGTCPQRAFVSPYREALRALILATRQKNFCGTDAGSGGLGTWVASLENWRHAGEFQKPWRVFSWALRTVAGLRLTRDRLLNKLPRMQHLRTCSPCSQMGVLANSWASGGTAAHCARVQLQNWDSMQDGHGIILFSGNRASRPGAPRSEHFKLAPRAAQTLAWGMGLP